MVSVDGPGRVRVRINNDDRKRAQLAWFRAREEENIAKRNSEWQRAMISVGTGRGFIAKGPRRRLVITSGNCLPWIPPCDNGWCFERRIYPDLLGPLDGGRSVSAQCCFVDPIADVAVLCFPGGKGWADERDSFRTLVNAGTPLPIGRPPEVSLVWMPSIDGRWIAKALEYDGRQLGFEGHYQFVPELAGAPIVMDDGSAIGVLCVDPIERTTAYFYPLLAEALPGWLLRVLAVPAVPFES
jgi:hypothetical protein